MVDPTLNRSDRCNKNVRTARDTLLQFSRLPFAHWTIAADAEAKRSNETNSL